MLRDIERRVARICDAVAAAPDAPWTSARMANAGGATISQMQRAFRATLGIAPRDFAAACRQRRFLERLRSGTPVTDAIYEAGFGAPSRVYESFRLPGMTPATYGRGGEGATIAWLTTRSPIGLILVAATARGVCFVEVGSSVPGLLAGLREEFPRADIAGRPSRSLRVLAEAAKAAADARLLPTSLPVDIRGTAFQWRVWRALTAIPIGETRTYAGMAKAIGAPAAVRAVARACARNPLALIVPCHRVVGAAGDLRGYRWGTEVKAKLLEGETRGKGAQASREHAKGTRATISRERAKSRE